MNPISQEQARFATFIHTAFEEITKICNAAGNSPALTTQQIGQVTRDGAALLEELKSLASQGTALRRAQMVRLQESYKLLHKRLYPDVAAGTDSPVKSVP